MANLDQLQHAWVIGVGCMGRPIAQRLIDGGFCVAVSDINPLQTRFFESNRAKSAGIPQFLATHSIACIVCVVDAAQTEAVLFGEPDPLNFEATQHHGFARRLQSGSVVVLCPTIGPGDTRRVGERLLAMGVGVLDAPMSGGPNRARDGTMSLIVSGSDEHWQRCQHLLHHMANPVHRISTRLGDASAVKLINNQLAAANLHAAVQAHALAQAAGLDAALLWDVVSSSSGQSWIAQNRMNRLLSGDDAVHARIALLAKDSALAQQMAGELGVACTQGALAAAAFAAALDAGWGEKDDSLLGHALAKGSR
jgi:L-threonate 2-dehydrogenase